jgi:hypothetical protein
MRDERQNLLRMPGHQLQRVHRTAAAGEQVHRTDVQRRDDPMQIVRLLLDRGLGGAIGAPASIGHTRVVGDDRAIGEMPGEGAEPGGAHR